MDLNSNQADPPIPLAKLPVGSHVCIKRILGGRHLVHRLLSLGLRVGSEIELTQRRGGGVVVANAGTRVALGAGVAEKLLVVPLTESEN
ncbi:MAG: ferrous iron transport protein A [Candidatus Thiodiazotropha sp. (ex Semelilucina semeliformis)]|nr:ferrous iron transport protein A [Candidatus Thiodiazotropha sp. (ex Semelilucina semeliformis)]MCU7828770.1 ferrous iron transport protein A [Candidatus Thiodiazotropha sp. (ex Myrtea sp. 'scaly one' KF741663)]